MGKKRNKRETKFKKFAQKTTEKLTEFIVKKSDGIIFIMKSSDDGMSYVKGDPLTIHILLEETAKRDKMFATVLKQVASRVDTYSDNDFESSPNTKDNNSRSFPEITVGASKISTNLGIDLEAVDKMTDKELEDYLDRFSNDSMDELKRRDREEENDDQDSPEE
jgi:hypothetical protein|tara:strand:+ start:879 stop:1370 length:492 start_codon:yes stop_codon:yes gene_type:complete